MNFLQQAPGLFGGAPTEMPGLGGPLMPCGVSGAELRCCMSGLPTQQAQMLAQQAAALNQIMQLLMQLLTQMMRGGPGALAGGAAGVGAVNRNGGASTGNQAGGAPGTNIRSNNSTSNVNTVVRQGKPIGANIAPAFDAMVAAAKKDGVDLRIESGFRSHQEQIALWNKYGQNPARVARPGTSNHEKGNAIDFANTPGAYAWLKNNAARFGLKNYPPEPWHYSTDGH